MKILTLIALLLGTTFIASAEDVNLKITYKGDGLSGHTVTVMLGNAALGSGVTDSGGEVTISVSSLPAKSIDLKGEKTCDGGRKSWSASGYVTLDGSNYAHVKMEDLVAEMVEASGGMMSESMLVASYGLVCSGSSSSSKENSSDSSEEEGESAPVVEEEPTMTREEMQAQQKQGLENKIASLDAKMDKKQSKIDSGKLTGDKKTSGEQSIREWEIEKEIAQNKLDKLSLQMEKGLLNKTERRQFKDKETELKDKLKAVKAEGKSGKSTKVEEVEEEAEAGIEEAKEEGKSTKEEVEEEVETGIEETTEEGEAAMEEANEYEFSPEDLANMSNNDLKKKKIGLKSDLSKKKLKLKTRRNALSPNEVTELEAEIVAIEKAIEVVDAELTQRKEE